MDPGEIAGKVASWLPWHTDEITRRFRESWPSLEHCWRGIGELFDCRDLSVPAVVDALAELAGTAAISLSLWNQWTHRARAHARERLQPSEWELFARWILDR